MVDIKKQIFKNYYFYFFFFNYYKHLSLIFCELRKKLLNNLLFIIIKYYFPATPLFLNLRFFFLSLKKNRVFKDIHIKNHHILFYSLISIIFKKRNYIFNFIQKNLLLHISKGYRKIYRNLYSKINYYIKIFKTYIFDILKLIITPIKISFNRLDKKFFLTLEMLKLVFFNFNKIKRLNFTLKVKLLQINRKIVFGYVRGPKQLFKNRSGLKKKKLNVFKKI